MNRKKILTIGGVLSILLCIIAIVLLQKRAETEEEESHVENTEATMSDEEIDEEEEEILTDEVTGNAITHEEDSDYEWDTSDEETITLDGGTASSSSSDVEINSGIVEILASGTYRISGDLDDGQIYIDADDDGVVRIILDDVEISNSDGPAIYVKDAEKTVIVLASGSTNYISDSSSYTTDEDDEANAAIFSTDDLTITGEGKLVVYGNYQDGISSKDGLVINSGEIVITAEDDGIRGKNYLVINDGDITVEAGGDGMKSDNEDEESMGYIYIKDGAFYITSEGDSINATTDVIIEDGEFDLEAGGGSSYSASTTLSKKGIKGTVNILIYSGTYVIDSADDAIHSNGTLLVSGGDFNISSGDDGMHADTELTISDGTIDISKSYEGIESATITINGGDIDIVSSDDGINVAGGNDSSSMGGRPGQGNFSETGDYYLYINGGNIYINATGDGIDVNGYVEMTDGYVMVDGPTSSANGALDYDGSFLISGGELIAVGASGMLQTPSSSSDLCSVAIYYTASSGNSVEIRDEDGNTVVEFTAAKSYGSIVYSSEDLEKGETYYVYIDGSQYTSFTISSVVTSVGSTSSRGRF